MQTCREKAIKDNRIDNQPYNTSVLGKSLQQKRNCYATHTDLRTFTAKRHCSC